MRRVPIFVVAALASAVLVADVAGAAPPGPTVATPDGRPVGWSDWLAERAPVALLMWASWVPDAERVLDDLGPVAAELRGRNLDLVVIVVQETLDEARAGLAGRDVEWLHDRYGLLLKQYRVVSIPRLLILDDEGKVAESRATGPSGAGASR